MRPTFMFGTNSASARLGKSESYQRAFTQPIGYQNGEVCINGDIRVHQIIKRFMRQCRDRNSSSPGEIPIPGARPHMSREGGEGAKAGRRNLYHPFFRAKRLFRRANTLVTLNWTYSRSRSSRLSFCISRRSSSLRSSSSKPRARPGNTVSYQVGTS